MEPPQLMHPDSRQMANGLFIVKGLIRPLDQKEISIHYLAMAISNRAKVFDNLAGEYKEGCLNRI